MADTCESTTNTDKTEAALLLSLSKLESQLESDLFELISNLELRRRPWTWSSAGAGRTLPIIISSVMMKCTYPCYLPLVCRSLPFQHLMSNIFIDKLNHTQSLADILATGRFS